MRARQPLQHQLRQETKKRGATHSSIDRSALSRRLTRSSSHRALAYDAVVRTSLPRNHHKMPPTAE